ncbi:nucleotidyltransferase-like protein [Bacillus sp. Marseille-P3661]|uniref:nucleotidyltransferase-like protein n=1 Tax=Bacillus sp. Marseille-P3661 TaxID=1936234 RepID=UPI000C83BCD9|nr:nucleotidyltransferase-like protein [Bacillus sp. Marseille-P3661]
MEDLLRPIYQEKASHKDTLGILLVEKVKVNSSLTEQFDAILIVLKKNTESIENPYFVKHYNFDDKKAALHIIDERKFQSWLTSGTNQRLIAWVLQGKILFERNEYIDELRTLLHEFPINIRKKKIGIEFSKLISSFSAGRDLYDSKQFLDAYSQMIKSLHFLARLSVIEHGFYPEVTVWNQLKHIEPEVYKLYLELVDSKEPIEKRVELLLLASEFAISSRTKVGSSFLIEVMKAKNSDWTIDELQNDEQLQDYVFDLPLLLQYLVNKNIIEIISEKTKGNHVYQRKYIAR